MILSTHHFWSHVAWSPTGICGIIGLDETGNSKISGAKVAFIVKNEVLWLDVSMDDVVEMEIFETHQDAGDEELGLHLFETTTTAHMVAQISSH